MGLDSLEILLSVEKEFGVLIDDRDVVRLTTPRLLADYIAARQDEAGRAKARGCEEAILRRVIEITATQTGIAVKEISPDHHFVQDLGLD